MTHDEIEKLAALLARIPEVLALDAGEGGGA